MNESKYMKIKYFILERNSFLSNINKKKDDTINVYAVITPWLKIMSENRIELNIRYFFSSIPLYKDPKKRTIKDNANPCENSPAKVLGMLPPHIE